MNSQRVATSITVLLLAISLTIAGCSSSKLSCSQVQSQLQGSTNKAVIPVPRPDDWWTKRHAAVVERVKQGNVGILFIGDSITHGWERQPELWDSYFGKWNPVNAGFSGDKTEHVLWRLEHGTVDGISPKLAVLMIGTNNSGGNEYTAEQIAEGIEAIVCTLRTRLPQTKVLILAIFPRGDDAQRKDRTQGATYNPQWAKNDKASQLAAQLADNKMIFFLDINRKFLNDQNVLTREVMPDLLHPDKQGYVIWGESILPTVEKLMK
ncbi:GDSL-type esterase/lipase family protein [Anaerohalosphaeraceae bacterium U12dextr]